jgi:hypothetical protein
MTTRAHIIAAYARTHIGYHMRALVNACHIAYHTRARIIAAYARTRPHMHTRPDAYMRLRVRTYASGRCMRQGACAYEDVCLYACTRVRLYASGRVCV